MTGGVRAVPTQCAGKAATLHRDVQGKRPTFRRHTFAQKCFHRFANLRWKCLQVIWILTAGWIAKVDS